MLVTNSILKEMKCDNDEDDTSFEDTLFFIKAFNKTLGQECKNWTFPQVYVILASDRIQSRCQSVCPVSVISVYIVHRPLSLEITRHGVVRAQV